MRYLTQVFIAYLVAQNFLSCVQSEEGDYAPPEIKNITPSGLISATDTVQIIFSEEIDTGVFALTFNKGSFDWEFVNSRAVRIFGTDEQLGRRHFPFGENIESIINELKDVKGNKAVDIPFDLEFYPWYDAEVFDRGYKQADTLMLSEQADTWRNGLPLDSLLISEGAIEGKWNMSEGDYTDYKLVFLEPQDEITIRLFCDRYVNLDVSLIGPFAIKGFEDYTQVLEDDLKNNEELEVFQKKTLTSGKMEAKKLIEFKRHGPFIVDEENNIGSSSPGIYIIRIEPVTLEDYGYYRLETQVHKFL